MGVRQARETIDATAGGSEGRAFGGSTGTEATENACAGPTEALERPVDGDRENRERVARASQRVGCLPVASVLSVPDNVVSVRPLFLRSSVLKLRSLRPLRSLTPRREPFAIYFLGPRSPILPQAIYTLGGDAVTFEQLFIVPVGQKGEGTEYEAIFT